MKLIFLSFLAVVFATNIIAKVITTLKNQLLFEGKVLRFQECEIHFRAAGQKYVNPSADMLSFEFEDAYDKVCRNYLEIQTTNQDLCLQGQFEVDNYHGKEAGHFFLGVLLGLYAMIGKAISNPTPYGGRKTYIQLQNSDYFNDPEFLSRCEKKINGKLTGMEATGWTT